MEDPAPKRYGSFIRRPLKEVVSSVCEYTQFGSGLNQGSIEAAHLYLRAQSDIVETLNKIAVVFFVDVTAVFAAMVRCLVVVEGVSQALLTRSYWTSVLMRS